MAAPKGVKILAALTLILTTGCASSPGGTSYPIVQAPVPDTLALELGEWNEAINTLTAQRNGFPASAEITYSLGLAYWGKLNSVRGNEYTFQHMGMLGRDEEFLLSEALLQFNAASEFQPSDEVAATTAC